MDDFDCKASTGWNHLRTWGLGYALLCTAAFLLSGCLAASPPAAVPVVTPEHFSASGRQPLPERWWQAFEDAALDLLVEQALDDNFSLRVAWDRLEQAETVAKRAGADIFPDLSGEAAAVRVRQRRQGSTDSSTSLLLGLTASYELDLWGRIRSSRQAAELDARASAMDLQAAAITLAAEVASSWYRLVETRGQLGLLGEQIAANEQVLELVTLRFRTGQVGVADVLQQSQLVEVNRGEKIQLEGQAKVLAHRLAILTGQPPGSAVLLADDALPELPAMPDAGIPSQLLQRRPDLRAAYQRLQAADRRVAAAVADRFPSVSLSARLDTSGSHSRDLFDNWLASLGGNLFGPLIDGGQRRAEVTRTRAVAAERLHTLGQTLLEALAEVEDALVEERHQLRFVASIDRQVLLAQQGAGQIRARYIKGLVDYQRVLGSILSLQQSQRTQLTARRTLVEKRIELYRSLAGGWSMQEPASLQRTEKKAASPSRAVGDSDHG